MTLFAIFLSLFLGLAKGADVIPHINDCNFCSNCLVEDVNLAMPATSPLERKLQTDNKLSHLNSDKHSSELAAQDASRPQDASNPQLHTMQLLASAQGFQGTWRGRGTLQEPTSPADVEKQRELEAKLPMHLRPSSYSPNFNDARPKHTLPNCTVCRGCNTNLTLMQDNTTFLGAPFRHDRGASSSWLFRATTNRTRSGDAVVKVYCVPVSKTKHKVPTCLPTTVRDRMRLFLALQRLADNCGLDEVVPRVWVDQVEGVIPGIGYHIRWYGLWMEMASGISIENLLRRSAGLKFEDILDLMNNRMNKTQVVLGSIFDLLTSQCDRHAQNIFISESGALRFIDNEACLGVWQNTCAFDSVLVPTSQKQEIIRLGNAYVLKFKSAAGMKPRNIANPQLLFDYRCYVDKGEIGTNYPPKTKQCLAKLASQTTDEIVAEYGFPKRDNAEWLRMRATDMHHKGFEWAYKYGRPLNNDNKRYKMQPPCCKVVVKDNLYTCAHPWQPSHDLPVGNPITGKAWNHQHPDVGSYAGGSVFR